MPPVGSNRLARRMSWRPRSSGSASAGSGWSPRTSGTCTGPYAPAPRRRSSSGRGSSGTPSSRSQTSSGGTSARSRSGSSSATVSRAKKGAPFGAPFQLLGTSSLNDVQFLFAATPSAATRGGRPLCEGRGTEHRGGDVRVSVGLELVGVPLAGGLAEGVHRVLRGDAENDLAVVVSAAGESRSLHR